MYGLVWPRITIIHSENSNPIMKFPVLLVAATHAFAPTQLTGRSVVRLGASAEDEVAALRAAAAKAREEADRLSRVS